MPPLNGKDVPDENPVAVRKPLARSVPEISASEPQSSALRKLVEGMIQIVTRVDRMDSDLVDLGASMIRGFESVCASLAASPSPVPAMRRREDSSHAVEETARSVGEKAKSKAEQIEADPNANLTPDVVADLVKSEVKGALLAQRESDRVKQLEAQAAQVEKDRLDKETADKEKKKADRDFRRNAAVAIAAALIGVAGAVYVAYMQGHEAGHGEGVAEVLKAVPAPIEKSIEKPIEKDELRPSERPSPPPTAPAAVAPPRQR